MNEPSGVRVWGPVTAGIWLWMAHLIALSSLTRWACRYDVNWIDHVITAALGALTVAAMVSCERLRRRSAKARGPHEPLPDLAHDLVFIGWFGLLIGSFSLALILSEGSWALTVPPCHP